MIDTTEIARPRTSVQNEMVHLGALLGGCTPSTLQLIPPTECLQLQLPGPCLTWGHTKTITAMIN